MAKKLNEEAIKVEFFKVVEQEWGKFIESICKAEAEYHYDPMLDYDDLKQDVMLYLYKYTFRQVLNRSTEKKIWIPYLRRSVKNCFINIRKSAKNWHHRLKLSSVDVFDLVKSGTYDVQDNRNPYNEYELHEFCEQVASMLDDQEREVFYEVVNPSNDFTNFLRNKKSANAEVVHSKTLVAEYFNLTYSRTISMFKKFNEVVELCDVGV